MGIVLGLLIAYYSGHVFGWVSPMMWLVVMLSLGVYIVLENCSKKEKEIKSEKENNKKTLDKFLKSI